ncbi:MAG: glycosyltransferase 87 family protein, partial [Mycobacteriales bacterium]
LVLTDFILLHRKSNYAGIGIGLAAAIKLTPLLFIVYLVTTRRWRPSATATATTAAATLLGAIALPSESWRYFTDLMFNVESISNAARSPNQSIGAFLARVAGDTTPPTLPWLVLVVPVAAFGLWRAYHAYRQGADLAGFTIVGLTTALVSPISWTHHLVWVIPALVVLVSAAVESTGIRRYLWGTTALGMFALFASRITMRYGDLASPTQLNRVGVLVIVDAYLIAILLLVALLPFPRDKKSETLVPS